MGATFRLVLIQFCNIPELVWRIHLIDQTLSGKKYKPRRMRHNGFLGNHDSELVTRFRLLILKVFFFIRGEILVYIY